MSSGVQGKISDPSAAAGLELIQISFASKVMGHLRFGFAAGCEAVATPRRTGQIIPGYAPGSGLALRIYWAKGRTKGLAQK
jgi:transposase